MNYTASSQQPAHKRTSSPVKEPTGVPYLKIQDWAKADRPREKLMQQGSTMLTDAELIGILIGSGTKHISAVSLAQLILKHYNHDLRALAKCSVKELQKFKGIGEAKAVAIVSAMEISRRRQAQDILKKPIITDSSSIFHLMKGELSDKLTEEFWIILLNKGNYVIKKQQVSKGGLTQTVADPKVIFKIALDHHAASIILVHNHPSGNPRPSASDIQLTENLVQAGKLLDITILDHIIFAEHTYFSFSDQEVVL